MNWSEAYEQLKDGKIVRRLGWQKNTLIKLADEESAKRMGTPKPFIEMSYESSGGRKYKPWTPYHHDFDSVDWYVSDGVDNEKKVQYYHWFEIEL